MKKKEICIIDRKICSCPVCKTGQLVVVESVTSAQLLDLAGNIIDYSILETHTAGKCINCHADVKLLETAYGYIPYTELRAMLLGKEKENYTHIKSGSSNPMEVNSDRVL